MTFRRPAALRRIGLLLAAGFLGFSCDDPVAGGGASPGAIVWDPTVFRQTLDGFGGSNAWHGLPSDPAASARVVELLFSPTRGIGLSLVRNRIPFRESTTYDDAFLSKDAGGRYRSTATPPGHRTFQLQWSNWDLANTKTLLSQASAVSPDLRVFSTPWTPPNNQYDRWKVDGAGNAVGGALGTVATWPDIGGALDPATAGLVSIVGVHQYDSDASTGKLAAPRLPVTKGAGKALWVTEVSSSGDSPNSMDDGLWVARLVHADLVEAEANAFCFWWLWSGDSPTNRGSLLGTSVVAYKRLYALGQYSRFIRPG